MLELELQPEKCLGTKHWEFILGMHFSHAVMVIQSQFSVIKSAQVIYSETQPLSKDLIINLDKDGIKLRFDPVHQRLTSIDIYNLKLVRLRYRGLIFNSEEVFPTMQQIEHSFGSTVPGLYDPNSEIYVIRFQGVSFTFPTLGRQSGVRPLGSPIASLVSIHSGINELNADTPSLPSECPFTVGEVYLKTLSLVEGLDGLRLNLYTVGNSQFHEGKGEEFSCQIYLGDSPQEVANRLGAPGNLFYKSDDKMKIHSLHSTTQSLGRTDYFFNYFTLGIDVLFDGRTHKAKKFILHTNYPGHYNFNIYHRCHFMLDVPVQKGVENQLDVIKVSTYTKWDSIKSNMKDHSKPVVLNRASSINTQNFFGPTLGYGYRDFIFEVMSNNHLASVTIYKSGGEFID